MQLIKRVIQSAKDRALVRFSVLTRLMIQEADQALVMALSEPRATARQNTLPAALQLLRREQAAIQYRIDTLFRESVDRGMRTMYKDLRQNLSNLSADTLTLIDDETVNKQLEVGHLVQSLRDACDENLGRLNIIIAQIHGAHDVSERENPFRPYFIARALYDTLKEKSPDEEIARVLFLHLSNSLAKHLSDFYASICEVFDSSGIQARLLARPTKLKQHQRDQLAQQLASLSVLTSQNQQNLSVTTSQAAIVGMTERALHLVQRMSSLLEQKGGFASASSNNPSDADASASQQVVQLQEFVWKLFNQSQDAPGRGSNSGEISKREDPSACEPVSPKLLSRLNQYQLQEAESESTGAQGSSQLNQLFSLSETLPPDDATQTERLAIDVVALLFEFILGDEQIPASTRVQIGRLQIPFLKAAMLVPAILQQAEHPSRQLLNRMGAVAVGMDASSRQGMLLDNEIARLVKRILQEFDKNIDIFADCLDQLNQFLVNQVASADAGAARSVQAAQEAEKLSILFHNTSAALQNLLAPMEIDYRAVDFIVQIWARVLVRAACQEKEITSSASPVKSISAQYHEVLPDLVWSVQEKQTPEERNNLIRLLPALIKRLKIGMLMIHMSEEECKNALDRLVPVHTQVLRANSLPGEKKELPTLDDLRKEFSRLVISEDNVDWVLSESLEVQESVLEGVLADRGAEADLALASKASLAPSSGSELLTQIQLGTCVQCWAADTFVLARAIWVSKYQSLFIFKMEQIAKPMVYSAASLLEALQGGTIRLIEYAPAFDRAVDALMSGVEAVQSARR